MTRRWLAAVFCLFLIASVLMAKPGEVINMQGDSFKGDVSQDDKFVYIDGPGGQIKLDIRNVKKITYDANVDDEYKTRHAKLADNDVKGRIDLAQWASEHNRPELAVDALTEARKIDPFNKDAARALDAAEQQVEMDKAAKDKATAASKPAGASPATGAAATTQAATPEIVLERRLLTVEEINIIRQKEMSPDDPKIKIKFDNDVVKKYLAAGDHDAAAFKLLTPQQQAMDILAHGDPKMAKDIHILTDPAAMVEFKQKVSPLIATGCASTACHGGMKAGNFVLYTGDATNAVYTNFYILTNYSKMIDGVKYLTLDRQVPEHSLVLQFGLPKADGTPPHPKAAAWKPKFKNASDPNYTEIMDWLGKTLNVMQPDYGFKVAVKLTPATQPAAGVPGAPMPANPVKPMDKPAPR